MEKTTVVKVVDGLMFCFMLVMSVEKGQYLYYLKNCVFFFHAFFSRLSFFHTLTNVTRSSMLSTTSVIARYSRTFLHTRMIFRTSDSSNANNKADVPCKIPEVRRKHIDFIVCQHNTHIILFVLEQLYSHT